MGTLTSCPHTKEVGTDGAPRTGPWCWELSPLSSQPWLAWSLPSVDCYRAVQVIANCESLRGLGDKCLSAHTPEVEVGCFWGEQQGIFAYTVLAPVI